VKEFKYLGQYWPATIMTVWKCNGKLWQPKKPIFCYLKTTKSNYVH